MSFDINDHEADPMMVDYIARREAGQAGTQDRANAAVLQAGQALDILSESDECDRASAEAAYSRTLTAARAVAMAKRAGEAGMAEAFCKRAESEAADLRAFDSARFDGVELDRPLADMRQVNDPTVPA